MPKHSLSIGLAALAAAMLLPPQAEADHENRYFGFGFPFFSPYNPPPPPPIYYPPPGVRETAPGIYEYEAAPGRWVRVRPGHNYQSRTWRQPQEAMRPPVPKQKPDAADEPEIEVGSAPAAPAPQQLTEPESRQAPEQPPEPSMTQQAPTAAAAGDAMSCEAAIEIVESFGFTDVRSTSCSGAIYGFDAARDGDAYAIKLSAADGALTEVRRR